MAKPEDDNSLEKQKEEVQKDFKGFYQLFYTLSILLSGAYVSSRSFAEYGSTAKGFSYYMLPTSNIE